ncbi:uncharacterized protein TNCV_1428481 [Trichonephila clavipes]|nr:uncharacterized protein TNCV_1428481 [Trichonephila clavipes]
MIVQETHSFFFSEKCSVPEVHHGRIERPSSFLSFMRRERRTELPVGQKLEDKVLLKLRCDDKYEPLGKHTFEETVNCENGEWSPIPQCEPAKCRRKPPESANATANKENGTHGETVMYTCKPPFQKEVHETIVCEFGQWTGLMPVCKNIDDFDKAEDMSADKKKCFVPKIPHGRIGQRFFLPWRKMDTWRELPVGQILEGEVELNLRCDYKYNPLGKPTIEETVACKDGEWSPIPQCEPAFNKEKDQLVSSSTSVTTVQQSALNTSTGNSCTCMYLSHDTNLVAYVGSKLLQSGSKVENNFKVKFHCNPFGYSLLNGPSEIKCQDCQWDFFVFPKCESRKTGESTLHINGAWQLLPGGVVGIEKGRILSITCEANGTGIVPQWSYSVASRIYVDTYRDHYSGRNVSMLYIVEVDTIHAGKYLCFVPGYTPNIIEIQLVTDTDFVPVKCPKIEDGHLFIQYTNEQNVGSVATMSCKYRHKTIYGGARRWVCLLDGQWSNRILPRCKAPMKKLLNEHKSGEQTGHEIEP